MAENRVQFGLKNCHYAVLTTTTTGGVETYTYGTPVAIPGGVTLTLDPAGEVSPFYADNIVYYQSVANNGYSGDLEVARFPDSFYKDIFGFTETTTSKVLMENSNTEPKEFALLYQIDGDASDECYVLYKCSATRPGAGSTTITETKEPQTQTSSITASPRGDGMVFARTTDATPAATKTSWFSSVFEGD